MDKNILMHLSVMLACSVEVVGDMIADTITCNEQTSLMIWSTDGTRVLTRVGVPPAEFK
jgi:hypothetical protein